MKPVPRIRLSFKAPALVACVALSVMTASRTLYACELEGVHTFDIPEGSLSETLLLIGRASGCAVAFKPGSTLPYHSTPIQGQLTVKQAMERAMTGSELMVMQIRNGSLTIRNRNARPPAMAEE